MEQTITQTEAVAELRGRLVEANARMLGVLRELDGIYDDARLMTGEDGGWDWDEPEEDYYTALDIRDAADMAANAMELARLAVKGIVGT